MIKSVNKNMALTDKEKEKIKEEENFRYQIKSQLPSKKSKITAGLLAIFLGGFGIHKFYLNKTAQGIIYLLLCWTLIPSIIAFFEGIGYLILTDEEFNTTYTKDLSLNKVKIPIYKKLWFWIVLILMLSGLIPFLSLITK